MSEEIRTESGSAANKQGLLDFELAPLTHVPPGVLIDPKTNDKLDGFVLALALAFNDLKLFGMVHYQLHQSPQAKAISPESGEHSGITCQVFRYVAAALHEVLKLIEKHQPLFTDPRFVQALGMLKRARPDWDLLVAAVHDKPLRSALERIRSNGTFHYYNTRDIVAQYRRHFFEAERVPENEAAYLSAGENTEQTRFYFADAAAWTLFRRVGSKVEGEVRFDAFLDRLRQVWWAASHAVGSFVSAWIVVKNGGELPNSRESQWDPRGRVAEPKGIVRQTGPSREVCERARALRKQQKRKRKGRGK